MAQNLFYQMRVKLRAEKAGLSSINWEGGQIVLRYPVVDEKLEVKRLQDIGQDVRGGKSAYWCAFGEEWESKLLDVLTLLSQ
jgi:transcription-repair coupling factor (superfamily II helicase)